MTDNPLHIRPYKAGDQVAVIALWQKAGLLVNPLNDPAADISLCESSGHGAILVGTIDETIKAATMVGHDGHRGWIYYVAVDPEMERSGFGRQMVKAAESWLTERNLPKLQLMVRSTNGRVIGFYHQLGYEIEERVVMSRRLDGKTALPAQPASHDPVIKTYLQMTARPELPQILPKVKNIALLKIGQPSVAYFRYLYDAVGRRWHWLVRKKMSDEALAAIIQDAKVEIFVLHVDGTPAGFFELDRRESNIVELAYFGIVGDYIGLRLGPYMLSQALERAWSFAPDKVTVNTCTLDHPKALGLYQRYGFVPYRQEPVPPPWEDNPESA